MELLYKTSDQNSFQLNPRSTPNDSNTRSLEINTAFLIQDMKNLCEEAVSTFYESDFDAVKSKLFNIIFKLNSCIDRIQIENEETSILEIFRNFEFDNFIFNICDYVIKENRKEEEINLLIGIIFFLTNLDHFFFQNHNLISFLTKIFFDFEISKDDQTKIVEIIARILSNQIIFDPNFENFSPYFFKILPLISDNSLKGKLIYSFINSSPEIKIYFQSLYQFLPFFFEQKRCSFNEIKIITKLIEVDNKILPALLNDGYISHILNSISKCKEEINIQIINFYLFLIKFDLSIREQFNFDQICIKLLNSESEKEQSCSLNYFCHFLPDCLELLYDKIGIDLLWAIISDGFLIDSTVELKLISIQFLLKLLRFNRNAEMTEIILNSNICEFCEIILMLDESEPTLICINILYILLNIANEDPKYTPIFIDNFKSSNIEEILNECSDEKIQSLASDFLGKINELCQKP